MSFESFMKALTDIDAQTDVSQRTTMVRIDRGDETPVYKFMSSAGAMWASIAYGPEISIMI